MKTTRTGVIVGCQSEAHAGLPSRRWLPSHRRRRDRKALRPALDGRHARAGNRDTRQRRGHGTTSCSSGTRTISGWTLTARSPVLRPQRLRPTVYRGVRRARAQRACGRTVQAAGCHSTATSMGSAWHSEHAACERSCRRLRSDEAGLLVSGFGVRRSGFGVRGSGLGARDQRPPMFTVRGSRSLRPSHAVRTNSSSNVPRKPGPGCQ